MVEEARMLIDQRGIYLYKFGPFRLHTAQRLLFREKKLIQLFPKAFDTLLVLVENSGCLVEKDELIKKVWPDVFVEESNLANNISILRKALSETNRKCQYIQTIPKRGYRFVAIVKKLEDNKDHIEQGDSSGEHQRSHATSAISAIATHTKLRAINDRQPIPIGFSPSLAAEPNDSKPEPRLRSIAVLPFKSIGAKHDESHLGLGIADALITRLSNLNEVIVPPTSMVLKYDSQGQDPVAAARELGVEAILEGCIQQWCERIRVTVQLVSERDGATLWADKFEEQLTDIFEVQDSLSEQIARALAFKLSGRDGRLRRLFSPVLRSSLALLITATQYYHQGIELLHRTVDMEMVVTLKDSFI